MIVEISSAIPCIFTASCSYTEAALVTQDDLCLLKSADEIAWISSVYLYSLLPFRDWNGNISWGHSVRATKIFLKNYKIICLWACVFGDWTWHLVHTEFLPLGHIPSTGCGILMYFNYLLILMKILFSPLNSRKYLFWLVPLDMLTVVLDPFLSLGY